MDVRGESTFFPFIFILAPGFACYIHDSNDHALNRSPQDVTARVDGLINEIREKYHRVCFNSEDEVGDVLIVAHGHILRAFAMRWVDKPLEHTSLILEAGGVGTLRYFALAFPLGRRGIVAVC